MIARLSKAAALCGVDRSTLYRWRLNDARIAACEFKRGWYIVEKLAALGLCEHPGAKAACTPTEPLKAGAA